MGFREFFSTRNCLLVRQCSTKTERVCSPNWILHMQKVRNTKIRLNNFSRWKNVGFVLVTGFLLAKNAKLCKKLPHFLIFQLRFSETVTWIPSIQFSIEGRFLIEKNAIGKYSFLCLLQ